MSDIKILLVDDHAVVRMGFKMLIEAEPDMTVIAEAESGELGIKAFKEHKPDIVIMDITMPGSEVLRPLTGFALMISRQKY